MNPPVVDDDHGHRQLQLHPHRHSHSHTPRPCPHSITAPTPPIGLEDIQVGAELAATIAAPDDASKRMLSSAIAAGGWNEPQFSLDDRRADHHHHRLDAAAAAAPPSPSSPAFQPAQDSNIIFGATDAADVERVFEYANPETFLALLQKQLEPDQPDRPPPPPPPPAALLTATAASSSSLSISPVQGFADPSSSYPAPNLDVTPGSLGLDSTHFPAAAVATSAATTMAAITTTKTMAGAGVDDMGEHGLHKRPRPNEVHTKKNRPSLPMPGTGPDGGGEVMLADGMDVVAAAEGGETKGTSVKKKPATANGGRRASGSSVPNQKRKEQNRAAQRAFRERKEKHVKEASMLIPSRPLDVEPDATAVIALFDMQLEDKVAELTAKLEEQANESRNLKELLTRLQAENVMYKQTAFQSNFQTPARDSDPQRAFGAPLADSPAACSSRNALTSPQTWLRWKEPRPPLGLSSAGSGPNGQTSSRSSGSGESSLPSAQTSPMGAGNDAIGTTPPQQDPVKVLQSITAPASSNATAFSDPTNPSFSQSPTTASSFGALGANDGSFGALSAPMATSADVEMSMPALFDDASQLPPASRSLTPAIDLLPTSFTPPPSLMSAVGAGSGLTGGVNSPASFPFSPSTFLRSPSATSPAAGGGGGEPRGSQQGLPGSSSFVPFYLRGGAGAADAPPIPLERLSIEGRQLPVVQPNSLNQIPLPQAFELVRNAAGRTVDENELCKALKEKAKFDGSKAVVERSPDLMAIMARFADPAHWQPQASMAKKQQTLAPDGVARQAPSSFPIVRRRSSASEVTSTSSAGTPNAAAQDVNVNGDAQRILSSSGSATGMKVEDVESRLV